MNTKILKIVLSAAFVLSFAALGPVAVSAQKKISGERTQTVSAALSDLERDARRELSRSPVGLALLDLVKLKEPRWTIDEFNFSLKRSRDDSSMTNLSFKNGKKLVALSIFEFDTVEEAREAGNSPRSAGTAYPDDRYGEAGEKIYGPDGSLWLLSFRIGNYRVTLAGKKEKDAERLAGYVSQTIKETIEKENR